MCGCPNKPFPREDGPGLRFTCFFPLCSQVSQHCTHTLLEMGYTSGLLLFCGSGPIAEGTCWAPVSFSPTGYLGNPFLAVNNEQRKLKKVEKRRQSSCGPWNPALLEQAQAVKHLQQSPLFPAKGPGKMQPSKREHFRQGRLYSEPNALSPTSAKAKWETWTCTSS